MLRHPAVQGGVVPIDEIMALVPARTPHTRHTHSRFYVEGRHVQPMRWDAAVAPLDCSDCNGKPFGLPPPRLNTTTLREQT
jgi:hypothetical protein